MRRSEFVQRIMIGIAISPGSSHDFEPGLVGAETFADLVASKEPFDEEAVSGDLSKLLDGVDAVLRLMARDGITWDAHYNLRELRKSFPVGGASE